MNARSFVVERFGESGWAAVVARLSAQDREIVDTIVAVGWYSLSLYARLIRAIDEVHGVGDCALLVQLGRYEAEKDLTFIHRMFLRMANPAFAVEKIGEYWRRFHDSGTWRIKRVSESHIEGELVDWGYVDHAACRELGGYMARVLELVGAKGVIMEHPSCRALGDATCSYRARWGASSVAVHQSPDETGKRRVISAPAATEPRTARRA
jgi:hypothetical protein